MEKRNNLVVKWDVLRPNVEKMSKRVEKQLNSFKYKGEPIKITIGTLVLTCLCILFLIVATFTQVTLTHPNVWMEAFSSLQEGFEPSHDLIRTYRYIPQIPVVFFIIALLGRKFGVLSILGYIVLGMFFPIFALGGGISYIFEYGFGYILAFIPVIILVGTLLKVKTDFFRILLWVVVGVLAIHILGVLYLLFVSVLQHAPMELVSSWIASQSGVQITYDIMFSLLGVYRLIFRL